jgi:hypothetical protein
MPPKTSKFNAAIAAAIALNNVGAAVTHQQTPHVLRVNSELECICFKRNGSRRADGTAAEPGPFFVVREWDAKVIRGIGKKRRDPLRQANGTTTEQALRASVRQAILNMNLRLEPANKTEIQYLKSLGVLGKRAPSASLLNVRDLIKLLCCFDKKRHAEDLKVALGGEGRYDFDHDMPDTATVLSTRITSKTLPKPITLTALPKSPIPREGLGIRTVELNLNDATLHALARKASRKDPAEQAAADRKRKATIAANAARAAAAAAAAGLGVEGLDALLSALRKPQEGAPGAASIEGERVNVDGDGDADLHEPSAKRVKLEGEMNGYAESTEAQEDHPMGVKTERAALPASVTIPQATAASDMQSPSAGPSAYYQSVSSRSH